MKLLFNIRHNDWQDRCIAVGKSREDIIPWLLYTISFVAAATIDTTASTGNTSHWIETSKSELRVCVWESAAGLLVEDLMMAAADSLAAAIIDASSSAAAATAVDCCYVVEVGGRRG